MPLFSCSRYIHENAPAKPRRTGKEEFLTAYFDGLKAKTKKDPTALKADWVWAAKVAT